MLLQCHNPECKTSMDLQNAEEGTEVPCPQCAHSIKVEEPGRAGLTLGDFKIVRSIAKGGMGEVYEAIQTSLDRRVALKVLDSKLANNESFIQRFEREAKAAASINHPGLVQVYHFGKEGDVYFLVMEYIDGQDLSKITPTLKDKRFPRNEAIRIVKDVAESLREALSFRIIHRDIKPANILLTSKGRVKVSDLGLAKNVDDDVELTQTGVGIGSPHFIAPEQADDARNVDHRADIYSLGITLLYLITGKRPYEGTSAFSVVLAHANKKLPTCEDLGLELDSNDQIEQVIECMTRKDPAGRYQDYGLLIQHLTCLAQGLPINWDDEDATIAATMEFLQDQDAAGESQTFVENDHSKLPPETLFKEEPSTSVDPQSAEIRKSGTIMMVAGIVLALFAVVAAVIIPPLMSGRDNQDDRGSLADQQDNAPLENSNTGIEANTNPENLNGGGRARGNQPQHPHAGGAFSVRPMEVQTALQSLPGWFYFPTPPHPQHGLFVDGDIETRFNAAKKWASENPEEIIQNYTSHHDLLVQNMPNDLYKQIQAETKRHEKILREEQELYFELFFNSMKNHLDKEEPRLALEIWENYPRHVLSPDHVIKVIGVIKQHIPSPVLESMPRPSRRMNRSPSLPPP